MNNETKNIKASGSPLLQVKGLAVQLQQQPLLHHISFSLQQGQHLAVTGPSGSGKTILAKALAGKLFHQGDVVFNADKPRIIFVEQHYHFKNLSNTSDFYYQQRYNSFDSTDALTVIDELRAVNNDEAEIDALLNQLQLQHRKQSPLLQLSSGEHKRFQLSKSFLQQADVLVIDSPFTGLDVKSREELHRLINKKAAEGTTIIAITDGRQLPACITHVAFLQNGRLQVFEEKEIFLSAHIHHLQKINDISTGIPFEKTADDFEVAVRMDNVRVAYQQKTIIENITWQVNRGEKWLLKGENGAGKSTLLSLVTGDHPQAYANKIVLFDRKRGTGESIWDIKRKIGYVSPELHWYFDTGITCYNAIASGFFDTIGLYKKLSVEQQTLVQQWLDFLRISSHVQHKPLATISTSQQRLTLLARALVKNPPLLVLDEPCQGLDEEQTQQFVSLTDLLCTELNKTLIYVSHYEHEIPACITNVLELKKGAYEAKTIDKKIKAA
ncbi:MAG TPA: ATP-binding cassette domain-containing protein [Chitinophagaceae bacterium]|nr:ATP-binding cassette domain-containing protein [Chitinophagaceae bacterium]